MKSAIQILAASAGTGDEKEPSKISVEGIQNFMQTMGEKMSEVEVAEILADCVDLQFDEGMSVDDFATFLNSR